MKNCSKCNLTKPLTEFSNRKAAKDGKRSSCKVCDSLNKQKYYLQNKAQIINQVKKHRKTINKMTKEQQIKVRTKRLRYYYKNKTNEVFKLRTSISNLIRYGFTVNQFKKPLKSEDILGCTYEEFKAYLESKFESWMNWENRGLYNGEFNYGWDLDHIIPICTAKSIEDVIKLNHYTNYQPLCSKINRDVKRGESPLL